MRYYLAGSLGLITSSFAGIHMLNVSLQRVSLTEYLLTLTVLAALPLVLTGLAAAMMHASTPAQRRVSGSGLADLTRTAAGGPDLWADIFLENRRALSAAVRGYQKQLQTFMSLLGRGDRKQITAYLKRAAGARNRL